MARQGRRGVVLTISAAVLTHDVYRYHREELLKGTIRSVVAQEPDALYVVSNGSTDGTGEYVTSMGGLAVNDPISTCGHGMNVAISLAVTSGCDVIAFANDDVEFRPGAFAALRRFWAEAPDKLMVASGLLEDVFPWNTVRERVEYGGVPALIRDSAPGGVWTLRASDWPTIGPVPEAAGWDDVPACERLRNKGYQVAQLDLAEHVGQKHSTWGNGSERFRTPLDPELRASLQLSAP